MIDKIKIIVHFGVHRTGTSTLAKYLKINRAKLLKENGILYPEVGVECRHDKLAWQLLKNKKTHHDIVSMLKNEIAIARQSSEVKTIILSAEDFSLLNELWLIELNKYFDLYASLYLRRQDLWCESWYNQHIKWPWNRFFSTASPRQFLEKIDQFYWIDYEKLLSKINKIIPKESIYVNIIQNDMVTDTLKDFLAYMKILDSSAKIDVSLNYNQSLSYAQLQILRHINLFDLNSSQRKKLIQSVKVIDIEEDTGSKIVFNKEERLYILEKFRLSNNTVAEKYFNRINLFNETFNYNNTPTIISEEKILQEYIPKKLLKEVLK